MKKIIFTLLSCICYLHCFSQTEKLNLISQKGDNKKYGFIDKYSKKLVIPYEYDNDFGLAEFVNGKCILSKDNRYGLIDYKNNILIAFEYDRLRFADFGKYLIYTKNNKDGLLDKDGKELIPNIYDKLSFTKNGENSPSLFIATKKNKYGIINIDNQIITPFIYDEISEIYDKGVNSLGLRRIGINDKYNLLDSNNKVFFEEWQESISDIKHNDYVCIYKKGKIGLVGINNNIRVKPVFDEINFYGYSDKILLSTKTYTILLDPVKKQISKDTMGTLIVVNWKTKVMVENKNDKYGIRDSTYKLIVPCDFQAIGTRQRHPPEVMILKQNNKFCFYHLAKKKYLTSFIYDDIFIALETVVGVKKNNKYGVVDYYGVEIIPFQYDKLDLAGGDLMIAKKQNKYQIISFSNRVKSELYDEIIDLDNYTFNVRNGNVWKKINLNLGFDTPQKNKKKSEFEEINAAPPKN
jgi:hypothetical protein